MQIHKYSFHISDKIYAYHFLNKNYKLLKHKVN